MLIHPVFEQIRSLGLEGMARALEQQMNSPGIGDLSFEERLGLLVDREVSQRRTKRLESRLKKAKLRQSACVEEIDYHHPRGLDRSLMVSLSSCEWIGEHRNILVTGPTGAGKTWLACALANQACREGYSVLYLRVSRLLQELSMARGDGRYAKLLSSYARIRLLVLDDWGLDNLTPQHRRDLLEIFEDRHAAGSTILTSQLDVDKWHEYIGEPTLADSILDRLVHNAYRIKLTGKSMRDPKVSRGGEKG